jgi:histidinol dehydrogenase
MKVYKLEELSHRELDQLCERNPLREKQIVDLCQEIFENVEARGDEAVREYTRKYDRVELEDFRVAAEEFQKALDAQPRKVISALETAIRNIRKFHVSQNLSEQPVEVQPGVICWRASRPISSVGLYVPAGTAVLPSTVLMLGVPAKLAGCPKIQLCVPPRKDGSVSPLVLAAAYLSGIRRVHKIGGAQAVAAMTLGTESVQQVDKILGPGNRFVQTAKLLATSYGVAIDMVAGPSEVLVIADQYAAPRTIAADLISQAEHGADSQVVLVTDSEMLIKSVTAQLEEQLSSLPRRELARAAMQQSFAVLVASMDEAVEFSNRYAPEHLILSMQGARKWVGKVQCAGSVFVGKWSPEVAGDYASGTNHTLPTSRLARNSSGVSLDSFVNKLTFQELTEEGLKGLAPALETLAEVESLEGHVRAVRYRLGRDKEAEG